MLLTFIRLDTCEMCQRHDDRAVVFKLSNVNLVSQQWSQVHQHWGTDALIWFAIKLTCHFYEHVLQEILLSSWLCHSFNPISISCWLPLIDSILLLAQCTSVDLTLPPLTVISIWRLLSEIPSVHQNCDAQQHVLSTAVYEPSTVSVCCISVVVSCGSSHFKTLTFEHCPACLHCPRSTKAAQDRTMLPRTTLSMWYVSWCTACQLNDTLQVYVTKLHITELHVTKMHVTELHIITRPNWMTLQC